MKETFRLKLLFTITILVVNLLVSLVQFKSAYAQPAAGWVRTYEYEDGNGRFLDIFASHDGGYVATGVTSVDNFGLDPWQEMWIVKTDSEGEVEWSGLYGVPNDYDAGNSIIQADDQDFVVAGYSAIEQLSNFSVWKVSPEGEQVWHHTYGRGVAFRVIELKGGNFIVTGYGRQEDRFLGRVLMIDGEGEIIWDHNYQVNEHVQFPFLRSLRETEGGITVAGYTMHEANHPPRYRGFIFKIDFDGELIWLNRFQDFNADMRQHVARPDGGFSIAGHTIEGNITVLYPIIINVTDEGDVEDVILLEDRIYREASILSITRVNDDGFLLVGGKSDVSPTALRMGIDGNVNWFVRYNNLHELNENIVENSDNRFLSVVVGHDGSFVTAGRTLNLENRRDEYGLIFKLMPEIRGVQFTYWSPEDTLLKVLQGDTVSFTVRAVNEWEEQNEYHWMLDDTLNVGRNDTTVTVVFEENYFGDIIELADYFELGDYAVKCRAEVRNAAIEIRWLVRVRDFVIDSHQPEELSLTIRRNTTVDFSINVRELEGDPILYDWSIQERPHGARDYVAEDTTAYSHTFPFSAEYAVEALTRRGEREDSRVWRVFVRSAIQNYYPREEAMSIPKGTMRDFWIEPFDPESDSLEYRWTLDGEAIGDTAEVSLLFEDVDQYEIIAYLQDGAEADSQMWVVNVFDPESAPYDDYTLPSVFALHPAYPNPFNNQTQIRFDIPIAIEVSVNVFDVRGRNVATLAEGLWSVGSHSVVWDASVLMSGIYFVKMEVSSSFRRKRESRENVFIQKAVLVK